LQGENGKMQSKTAIKRLLKIEKIAIQDVYFERDDKGDIFIVAVCPYSREKQRCPKISPRKNSQTHSKIP
jgi:hypothetical protein